MSGFSPEMMSGDAWQEARRETVIALMRALGYVVAVIVIYYLLPLNAPAGRATVGWLVLGLMGFTLAVALQLRSILHSHRPALRAITMLSVTVPAFVVGFAATYLLLDSTQPQAFTESLTHTDALYFSMTVLSTVGFGDIAPRSEAARLIVSAQMAGNLIVLGFLARLVIGAVKITQRRQADTSDRGGPSR